MRWFTTPSAVRTSRPTPVRRVRLQLEALESRLVPYSLSGNAWTRPELVRLSFVPDGTDLGGVTSNLFSSFNARFGSPAAWQQWMLMAAQSYAQQTNLNFAVVPDNGAPIGSGGYQQGDPGFGDIRIGGYHFGTSGLAQAFLPPPVNNYSVAGDVFFNTGQTFNVGSTYDLLTVAWHEIGHALGLYHSSASTPSVLWPSYNGLKYGLDLDDQLGIRAIYSGGQLRSLDDLKSYNAFYGSSFSTAIDVSPYLDAATKTLAPTYKDLTIAAFPYNVELYKVTAPAGSAGSLKIHVQTTGISLLSPKVTVYDAAYQQIGFATAAVWNSATLDLTVPLAVGQAAYFKVEGVDTSAFATGRYGLSLSLGAGAAPATPGPNPQVANGSPLQSGGGIPMGSPGHDGDHDHEYGSDSHVPASDRGGSEALLVTGLTPTAPVPSSAMADTGRPARVPVREIPAIGAVAVVSVGGSRSTVQLGRQEAVRDLPEAAVGLVDPVAAWACDADFASLD